MDCVEVYNGPEAAAVDLGVPADARVRGGPFAVHANSRHAALGASWAQEQASEVSFPAAPTQGGPAGSEWFPLDIPSWMMAFMGGQDVLAKKLRETPEGIKEASDAVVGLLKELVRSTPAGAAGDSLGAWLVGGFSQGAMMTVDVCARLEESPAGMLLLSGMPMNINEWAGMAKHKIRA